MRIFIIGIAGGTGSRVARSLVKRGDEVSGLYRKHEEIGTIRGLGANGVFGDIATISEEELTTALSNIDAIVFSAGASEQDDDSMIDTVDYGGVQKTITAAQRAGVSRFLLVSVFPEAWRERNLGPSFDHYIAAKKKADVALAHSGLNWIILRPSILQDYPGTGRVSLSSAEIHGEVARDDVAETIVGLLHTEDIRKRILELTAGNESIPNAIAALLNES